MIVTLKKKRTDDPEAWEHQQLWEPLSMWWLASLTRTQVTPQKDSDPCPLLGRHGHPQLASQPVAHFG